MRGLPILTLDEHVLSPRFGYVFQARWVEPYESVLGMLWKFVRANRLSGAAVVAQIGTAPTDPYEGLEPVATQVDCRVVARLLQIRLSSVVAGLLRPHQDRRTAFKYCARCLAWGYHGIIHQAEGRRVCPVHRCAMHERCRHCRQTFVFSTRRAATRCAVSMPVLPLLSRFGDIRSLCGSQAVRVQGAGGHHALGACLSPRRRIRAVATLLRGAMDARGPVATLLRDAPDQASTRVSG